MRVCRVGLCICPLIDGYICNSLLIECVDPKPPWGGSHPTALVPMALKFLHLSLAYSLISNQVPIILSLMVFVNWPFIVFSEHTRSCLNSEFLSGNSFWAQGMWNALGSILAAVQRSLASVITAQMLHSAELLWPFTGLEIIKQ